MAPADASSAKNVNTSTRVLMLPFLAYSHISPFLELAKKLIEIGGIHIYISSTPINLSSISKKIMSKYSESIELLEYHLQELPQLPSHYHTTNGLPTHLLPILYKLLRISKPEIDNIVKSVKPDLVIYDSTFSRFSVTPLHSFPSVWFHIVSTVALSYTSHLLAKSGSEYPFPAIYLRDFEQPKLLGLIGDEAPDAGEIFAFPILFNTSRELEGKYLDHFADTLNQRILPVGPLIPTSLDTAGESGEEDNELINWLGKKKKYSTVYASFGTMYFLSEEEIKEIAFGLESSNANFIWALRSPDGDESKIEGILPEGFLELVGDRGRVVQGWVPQARILSHSSIGGFLSHCGWISLAEGIEFGVPIIAMPMTIEQPINGRLFVENDVAIEIMRDKNGRLEREEIAKVINHVVIEGGGESLRHKIKDLRKKIKSGEKEKLDGLVTFLAQLSKENSDHRFSNKDLGP